MKSVLVIYAHPSPNKSGLHKYLFEAAGTLSHVVRRDLYELYPNLHIDIDAEQDALRAADTLVFQFPVHWFSSPAILKEWQDTVLSNGFAYGTGENVLAGKHFMLAVSTGGSAASYSQLGRHGSGLENYLKPFEQTARFCGMKPLDNFIVQSAGDLTQRALEQTVQDYCGRLNKLGGDTNGN